jgi:hypothetical protein
MPLVHEARSAFNAIKFWTEGDAVGGLANAYISGILRAKLPIVSGGHLKNFCFRALSRYEIVQKAAALQTEEEGNFLNASLPIHSYEISGRSRGEALVRVYNRSGAKARRPRHSFCNLGADNWLR